MELLFIALSSLFSLAVLFLIAKLIGHRQIAQLDVFDYITGITIGSIAAEMAVRPEDWPKMLVAMVIYGLATVGISLVTNQFGRSRKLLNGTPTILYDEGKLYRDNLKKAKMDLSEFLVLCRSAGYFDLADIQTAVFEFTGKISFLPADARAPVTPETLQMPVSQRYLFVEVIMDGRILDENLRRMGLDSIWLTRQLKAQGFHGAEEIFLGVCDRAHSLSLYPMEQG